MSPFDDADAMLPVLTDAEGGRYSLRHASARHASAEVPAEPTDPQC